MSYQVELAVRLKIPDVTALTAANAIRRRLGYAEALADLKRADHYVFDVEAASAEEAEALVRHIAQKTTLFVNPNKHVFAVRFPEDRDGGAAAPGLRLPTPGYRITPRGTRRSRGSRHRAVPVA